MRHEARLFFVALQFLTRVPIPRWVGFEPDWLHASARYFPLVGSLVGALGGAVFSLALWLMGGSPWVAAWLAVAAMILCTGAFHEDGWADTCDALGGAVDRQRALEIMKDSRIGTYGAAALVLMLGMKVAVLAAMPPLWVCAALLMAHTASRGAAVSLIRFLSYAGDVAHAKAKPLAQRVSVRSWGMACAWSLGWAVAGVAWRPGWIWPVAGSLAVAAAMAVFCARWFQRRLGGVTGDALGAAQQLAEMGVLLVWLAACNRR